MTKADNLSLNKTAKSLKKELSIYAAKLRPKVTCNIEHLKNFHQPMIYSLLPVLRHRSLQ
jgi:hypothetical protein